MRPTLVTAPPETILDRFLQQVQLRPDARAVEYGTQHLSCWDLEQGSASWAEARRRRGVGLGHRVSLSVERGLNLALAFLAVLRTGAAYVPLDPSYPKSRLKAMATQAGLRLILSDSAVLPELPGVKSISPAELGVLQDVDLPAVRSSDTVYVIFTSGPTGEPKSVMLSHGALHNLIAWQIDEGGLGVPARVLQFSPSCFDVHFEECFGTWCIGGTVVLVAYELRRDPQRLAKFQSEQRVERLFMPYVALPQLADAAMRSEVWPTHLRDSITTGEQLVATPSFRRFFQQLPHHRLNNHYGPSETYVATAYTLPVDPAVWKNLPPIGTAVRNTLALVVDEHSNVVDDGNGELFFGGACVADGHCGMPERTAKRFVYLPGNKERFYRAGDLVRKDARGHLYYLGRTDGQVKIRGYRVETTEIEMALNRLPDISASAVVAEGNRSDNRRLIAYLIPDIPAPDVANIASGLRNDWRTIWDTTYDHEMDAHGDPTFDISGWHSSYDGAPLPADHWRRWVDGTRARLLRNHPHWVLEIGAGTGLILFSVANDVEYYHAVDYLAAAVRTLNGALARVPELRARCATSCSAAHEVIALPGMADANLDTIINNSVTQHFESGVYLEWVFSDAVQILPHGGTVFVGDVTSRSTRRLHFRRVEHFRAGSDVTLAELDARVAERLAGDQELLVDAEWFYQLPQCLTRVRTVDVQLNPGGHINEMSQFRFDVILRVTPRHAGIQDQVPWPEIRDRGAGKALQDHFANGSAGPLRVHSIPYARLAPALALQGEYAVAPDAVASPVDPGIDPDDCIVMADTVGGQVQTFFSKVGYFDAVCGRPYQQALSRGRISRPRQTRAGRIGRAPAGIHDSCAVRIVARIADDAKWEAGPGALAGTQYRTACDRRGLRVGAIRHGESLARCLATRAGTGSGWRPRQLL